jgi:PAS domain S-box-containing protein
MARFSTAGLRGRLLLLVLLAVVPASALTLYGGVEERRQAALDAQADTIRLTRLAAANHEKLVEGAQQLLVTLAHLPPVLQQDGAACHTLFRGLVGHYPHYTNFGVADGSGRVFCSALPHAQQINAADRNWYRRALHARDFAIGDYQRGPITGKEVLVLGYPVVSPGGKVRAVVFAALDMAKLNQVAAQARLPEGAVFLLIDSNGTILARSPNPERWVGRTVPEPALFKTILARGEGTAEVAGVDGVLRLWAFTPVHGGREAVMYVSIGLSKAAVLAPANRLLARHLTMLAIFGVMALAAAWWLGDLFVLRHVNALLGATSRLRAGDLSARTGLARGHDELGQLALAFDDMAATLEAHDAQRAQVEAALRDGEERYRDLVENANDVIYTHDLAGNFTSLNRAGEMTSGYSRDEALTMNIAQVIAPEHLDLAGQMIARKVGEGGPTTYPLDIVAKDGTRVPVEVSTRLIYKDGLPVGVQGVARDVTERKRAEQQLHLQASALEAAANAIMITDSEGIIIWANPAFTNLTGYTPEEALGQSPRLLKSGQHDPSFYQDLWSTVLAGHVWHNDLINRRKDGSLYTEEQTITPVRDDRGEISHFVAIKQDISERKRAEATRRALYQASLELQGARGLQERLDRFLRAAQTVLELDRVNVLLADPAGDWLQAVASTESNTALAEIRVPIGSEGGGIAQAYRTQQPVVWDGQAPVPAPLRLYPPYDQIAALRSRGFALVPLVVQGRAIGVLGADRKHSRRPLDSATLELLQLFAAQVAVVLENTRLYREAQERLGETETLLAVSHAVGSTLDLQEALRRGARELARALHADSAGAYLVSPDGQQLCPVAGYHLPKEILSYFQTTRIPLRWNRFVAEGCNSRRPIFSADCHRDPRWDEKTELFSPHATVMVPFFARDKLTGSLFAVWWDQPHTPASPELELAEGIGKQLALAVENVRLVADLQAKVEELQRAQAKLVETERLSAMGQMAAGVAHDFNNALATLLTQTELMRLRLQGDHIPKEELLQSLARQERAALDAAETVRRIRESTRPRGRELSSAVTLNDVVAQVVETTRPRWKDEAEAQGIAITATTELAAVPQVLGREAELREALTNLIFNAIDALPAGGTITVATRAVPASDGHQVVELSVTDTGIGMSEAVQQRLFEPFFTTKGARGTGLGLSMVQGIVRRHEGEIAIASVSGYGTTVTIYLPVAAAAAPAGPLPSAPPSLPRPVRVLVIDDVLPLAETVCQILRTLGHDAHAVASGREGLHLLERSRVDLVFTDLGMPEMSGWEVAQAIKSRWQELPVVLVTGWGDAVEPEALDGTGVDLVLAKPFTKVQLQAVLAQGWALTRAWRSSLR